MTPRRALLLLIPLALTLGSRAAHAQWACDVKLRDFITQTMTGLVNIDSVEPAAGGVIHAGDEVIVRGQHLGAIVDNNVQTQTQLRFLSGPFPGTDTFGLLQSVPYVVVNHDEIRAIAPADMIPGRGRVILFFWEHVGPCWLPLWATFARSPDIQVTNAVRPGAPPPAVGDLRATPVSPRKLELVWTDISGEDAYEVWYTEAGGPWTALRTYPAGTTSIVAEDAIPGTRYEFKLVATNSFGRGPDSNIASAVTPTGQPLPPPPDPEEVLVEILDSSPGAPITAGTWAAQAVRVHHDGNQNRVLDSLLPTDFDLAGAPYPLSPDQNRFVLPCCALVRGNGFQGNLVFIVQIEPTFGARADAQYVALHFSVQLDPSGNIVGNSVLEGGSAGDFDASDGRRIMIVDPGSVTGTLTGTTRPGGGVSGDLDFVLAVSEPVSIDPFQAESHLAIAHVEFNDLAVLVD